MYRLHLLMSNVNPNVLVNVFEAKKTFVGNQTYFATALFQSDYTTLVWRGENHILLDVWAEEYKPDLTEAISVMWTVEDGDTHKPLIG